MTKSRVVRCSRVPEMPSVDVSASLHPSVSVHTRAHVTRQRQAHLKMCAVESTTMQRSGGFPEAAIKLGTRCRRASRSWPVSMPRSM